MPQIPIYQVPESESQLRIPEGGAATLAQAGRRLGTLGNEAATPIKQGLHQLGAGVTDVGVALERAQTDAQVSKAPLLIAQDQTSRMQDLNNLAYGTNPNDLSAALGKYSEENLSGAKDKFMENFTTPVAKRHAEALWDQHEAHIYNHVTALSIQASADAAHNNLIQSVNTFSQNVGQDPSLLDANLALTDQAIATAEGSVPKGKVGLADSFGVAAKREMVASAFKTVAFGTPDGKMSPNPDLAQQMLDSGKYDDIMGEHNKTLQQTIDLAKHQVRADLANANTVQVRQAQQVSSATSAQALDRINAANFGLGVLHDDRIQPEDKAALINAANYVQRNPQTATTPATLDHFITRLADPSDKPTTAQILGQVSAGNLSLNDAKWLTTQVNSPAIQQLHTVLSDAKIQLYQNRGSGLINPAGVAAYQRFQSFAVNVYKNGAPIEIKALPDILASYRPTAPDAIAASPQQPLVPGALIPGGALTRPPTEAQLPLIERAESSGQNVPGPMTDSGRAEGHYQITTGTWRDFAARADVDLAQYPNPLSAPKAVQAKVALVIPLQRWDPRTLRYMASQGAFRG